MEEQLLTRIDERTSNIYTLVEKQEQHLAKINNKLEKHELAIAICETRGKETRNIIVWFMSGVVAIIGSIVYYILRHIGMTQ